MSRWTLDLLGSQLGAAPFLVILNFLEYFQISKYSRNFHKFETLNDWLDFNIPWWIGLSIVLFIMIWFQKSKKAEQ